MTYSPFTLGLVAAHPQNAARTLEAFEPGDLGPLLTSLPVVSAAAIVREMSPALAAASLATAEHESAAGILHELDTEVVAMILRRLDKDQRHEIIALLPASTWIGLRVVLRYPEDTAGSLMDPNVLSVPDDMPIGNVLRNMQLFKRQLLHAVYVTDRRHVFTGILDVRELFFAGEQQIAAELTRSAPAVITARTNLQTILSDAFWAGNSELPVVDHQQRFLGVLHRLTLHKALEHLNHTDGANGSLTETALALGELIWSTCAGIFGPTDSSRKENSDDK